MRLVKNFVLTLTLSCLGAFAAAHAQAGKAELTGSLRDQNRAAVTQARVAVTEIAIGQTYSTTVTDNGDYAFTNLKPGTYNVAVEADGLKGFVREGVRLPTGERVRLDVELQPGAMSETVTVTQDASLLRTESGSLGQVIGNRKIVDIPLNGRNFLSLVTLSAGVAQPPPTTAGPSFSRINGGRPPPHEYFFHRISFLPPKPRPMAVFPLVETI